MVQIVDYLNRLELSSAGEPTPSALKLLQERHLLHVPFENLDVRTGVPIELDVDRLLDKIVTRRRGGFCYELNGAFAWLLREVGYQVDLIAARVHVGREEELGIPFDHLALVVHLERDWLVDVGFGDSFHHPLPLDSDDDVVQHGSRFRIVANEDGTRRLERYERAELRYAPQYTLDLDPRELSDFDDACRHHQTSPESHFTQKTVCSIAAPDGRLTLADDRLILTRQGRKEEQPLTDDEAWLRALKRHFHIELAARP